MLLIYNVSDFSDHLELISSCIEKTENCDHLGI